MAQLKLGQILLTTSNHGDRIDSVEMLLLPKAKLSLTYDIKSKMVNMTVADIDILTDNLDGTLNLDTINDLIKILCRLRNQIKEDQII